MTTPVSAKVPMLDPDSGLLPDKYTPALATQAATDAANSASAAATSESNAAGSATDAAASAASVAPYPTVTSASAGDVVAYDGTDIRWGPLTAAQVPDLSGTYATAVKGGIFNLADFIDGSPDLTGATDYTSQMNAAIAAAHAASGGVVQLPGGTIKLTSGAVVFPNDGVTPVSGQKTILIRGTGSTRIGNFDTPTAGTTIVFHGSSPVAHIDTRGMGLLQIEDVTLTTDDTTGTPFIRSTNTVLLISKVRFLGPVVADPTACVTDAIVLGGTGPNGTFDMTVDARFQGYGTVIERCEFSRIRRGVLGQAAANSIVVRDCYWHKDCGGSAALEIHSYGNESSAWHVAGNCIEVTYYTHAVVLYESAQSMFFGNSYWDAADAGNLVSCIDLQGAAATSMNNIFIDFFQGLSPAQQITDTAGGNQWFLLDGVVVRGKTVFGAGANGVSIQPSAATGSESARLMSMARAGGETVSPNLVFFFAQQNGVVHAEGAGARFEAMNGASQTNYANDGVIQPNAADLAVYAGTAAANSVAIKRGGFKLFQATTAARPTGVGEGYMIYDLTLHKPVFWDGTGWKDLAGNAA